MEKKKIHRKATTIRFDVDLMTWLTNQARLESKSFNAYMMEMAQERRAKVMAMSTNTKISPELKSLCGIIKPYTEEEIEADTRLLHMQR